MKLVTYHRGDQVSFGIAVESGIVDIPRLYAAPWQSVKAVLEADALAELAQLAEGATPTVSFDDVTLMPPVSDPGKVFCIGVNYVDHRAEAGLAVMPRHPTVFTRFSDSHVGHDHPVVRPAVSAQLDYEGEVAIVIGRSVPRGSDDATFLSSIAGMSCYNDLSVRDYQLHNSQWVPGKNFRGVGSFGPWLVTLDEFPDLPSITLETRVNGEVRQQASLADLIFDFPAILRYLSEFTVLSAGDVVVTGTPGGVGIASDPPRFLQPGDVVEVGVSGIGVLRNAIVAAPSAGP